MKKTIQTINEKLKIANGRKLSSEQMVNARQDSVLNGIIIQICSEDGEKEDIITKSVDGTYVRREVDFDYMETPDISHGARIMHRGYYPNRTIVSKYNSTGELTERTISYGGVANPSFRKPLHELFNPAGSWIGKKPTRKQSLERRTLSSRGDSREPSHAEDGEHNRGYTSSGFGYGPGSHNPD